MQQVIEFLPWVVFFVAYKFFGGLYPATAALMVSMALLLAYDWIATRKVPQMHLALAVLVWIFGAATLILHDVRFLQWKASVFYWLIGLAFGGSAFVGEKSLLERLLGQVVPPETPVPRASWRSGSIAMGLFNIALGFVNWWVFANRSEGDWVTFKVWIAYPVAVVFSIGVALWVLRGLFTREPSK